MQFNFNYPSRFEDGQALSAYDINKYRQNNALIRKLLYSPQQLPMDSNVYSPKSVPLRSLSLAKAQETLWIGSFMYRTGMKKAYLGMSVSLENAITTNTDISVSANTELFNTMGLAIILKHTNLTYKQILAKGASHWGYFDAVNIRTAINTGSVISNGKGIDFFVKNGNASANVTPSGTSWATIDPSKKITTIEVDLEGYSRVFQDGEIVPISILLLASTSNTDATFSQSTPSNFPDGALKYPYVKHTMFYAETDGDLSYSKNWSEIPAVVTSGNSVLSKDNLNALSDKQTYIIERLSNRPGILTGSVMYYGLYAGTMSQRYISYDFENFDDYFTQSANVPEAGTSQSQVARATTTNAETTLATFAWNPYLDYYNQVLIDYKFYGNTDTKQFMIVEIPSAFVAQPHLRRTDGNNGSGNQVLAGNLFGGAKYIASPEGATLEDVSFSYPATAVKNIYDAIYTTNSISNPLYKIYPFQVRIPSPSTPVFKLEDDEYKYDAYFRKGFYQDTTAITFASGETSGSYRKWKLPKAFDAATSGTYTSQIGFIAEISGNLLPAPLTNSYEYQRVANYNNSDWSWVSPVNGTAGHRPIYINLYDHSFDKISKKANYISFMHLISVSAFNSANLVYSVDTDIDGNTTTTYSGLKTTISGINSDLDTFHTNLFGSNPHFYRYQMFWGNPQSFVNSQNIIQEYTQKFFMYTQSRKGDILIVRGRNVNLNYGSLKEITRSGNPAGSFIPPGEVDVSFESTQNLISSDTEQTIIFNLSNAEGLAYGQQYFLTGDIVYAAEFFEEPS